VLLPPEGNALSTELQGLLLKTIPDSRPSYKRTKRPLSSSDSTVRKLPRVCYDSRMNWKWICLCAGVCFLTAACSTTPPAAETLEPLRSYESIATEAVSVQQTAAADTAAMNATIEAAARLESQHSTYNALLLATVRANEVPTPSQRLAMTEGGAMAAEMLNLSDGQMRVQQIGTAGFVRPEDNCFETHQQFFNRASTNVIYMTALVTNLQSGTTFRVDWIYNNRVVHTSTWSAPSDEIRRCLALAMRASDVVFSPGAWSARLFMNNVPIGNSAFEILG
jgi:hypothetical protein